MKTPDTELIDKIYALRKKVTDLSDDQYELTQVKKELKSSLHDLQVYQEELRTQNEDLRMTKEELEESHKKYLDLFEFAPIGYFTFDSDYRIMEINLTGADMLGHSRRYLIGKPMYLYAAKKFHDVLFSHFRGIFDNLSLSVELELKRKGHITFPVELKSIPVEDRGGAIKYCRSAVIDVTGRKQAEEKLHMLSCAIQQSPCVVMITDLNGDIEYVNPKFSEITGYNFAEVIGKNPRLLKSEKLPQEEYNHLWQNIISGKDWRGKFYNKKKNGEFYWESAHISPVRDQEGAIRNFIAIKEDITKHKRSEELLLQTEKLRAMGVISSGVAHEFNNILAIIKSHSQLLDWKFGNNSELADGLRTISQATDDGAGIVRRLKEFTRTKDVDVSFGSVDIEELIKQAIKFLKPRWKNMALAKGIKYCVDTKGLQRIPAVKGNTAELREVLINIINNAMDSMPGGGSITVRTRINGDALFVSITDTGKGMTEDVQEKIFDPFFTTKTPEGTGLGMSVVYGIIKRHGGTIEVKSELGKGSTITFSLAITKKTETPLPLKRPTQNTKLENIRILVVDDEREICKVLNKYFSERGHTVKSVCSGSEAIKLLKSESFDLVLCDLIMPEVSGRDVIKKLNTLEKRPKVALLTGWSEKIEESHNEDLQIDMIIKKPFDFSDLSKQINDLFNNNL